LICFLCPKDLNIVVSLYPRVIFGAVSLSYLFFDLRILLARGNLRNPFLNIKFTLFNGKKNPMPLFY